MVARAGVGSPSGGEQTGLPFAENPGRLPAANLMVSADGATPRPPLLSEKRAQHPLAAGFSAAFGRRTGPICASRTASRGRGAEAGPSPLRAVRHVPGLVGPISSAWFRALLSALSLRRFLECVWFRVPGLMRPSGFWCARLHLSALAHPPDADGRRPRLMESVTAAVGRLFWNVWVGCLPGGYSHALSDMSSDLIWWVSAPTEMKSTPHSA